MIGFTFAKEFIWIINLCLKRFWIRLRSFCFFLFKFQISLPSSFFTTLTQLAAQSYAFQKHSKFHDLCSSFQVFVEMKIHEKGKQREWVEFKKYEFIKINALVIINYIWSDWLCAFLFALEYINRWQVWRESFHSAGSFVV